MVISQKKSIQKKLLAATSMLLVACIMLISASYAWFTLSTAPEITGITTTIGANGNLEIALADDSTWGDPDSSVKTNVGSSLVNGLDGAAVKGINITWGNLIDVSKDYGLDKITLLPSRLNITGSEGKWEVNAIPLATPIYGSDGRVSDLTDNTAYAQYNGTDFLISDAKGVRIIGAASGMTDRQLAYRSAKVALANTISDAKVAAKTSLEANGTDLANIVMQKAVNESPTYTQDDVKVIKNVLAGVTIAQQKMLGAWEAAVISYAASQAGEKIDGLTTETEYLAFKAKIDTKDYDVSLTTTDTTVTGGTITANSVDMVLPGQFAFYYSEIQKIAANIASANTEVTTLESDDNITWADLRKALDYIVNADEVTVNGLVSTEIKKNLSKLVSAVAGGSGIQVEMPSGAGVYADIADFCEDYSATVWLQDITYGDITLGTAEEPIKATMKTVSEMTSAYFTVATNTGTSAKAPAGSGAANNKLSDMFGYAIDYYMRTNAANANLMLQVNEAQRIYTDSTNEDTMGGGSNMTFTSSDTNYTTTQMLNLMKAIRVIFMLPLTSGNAEILAVAKLDTENADIAGNVVKADLKLCAYSVNTTNSENLLEVADFKDSQVITAMKQNQAMKLSTLVYLDGDYVTNAMVANAAKSMTGNLNLQFATDANLVPMDDTALKGVTTGGTQQ